MILSLTTVTALGQIQLVRDTLTKKHIKTSFNNGYIIEYLDRTSSSDNLPQPKDINGQVAELMDQKLNSIENLNKISNEIFTTEEIKYLNENRCYISCILNTSGKIISASVMFYNNDPVVNVKQLTEFSRKIKENLTFKLLFNNDVNQDGYLSLSFPAFPSLNSSKKSIKLVN